MDIYAFDPAKEDASLPLTRHGSRGQHKFPKAKQLRSRNILHETLGGVSRQPLATRRTNVHGLLVEETGSKSRIFYSAAGTSPNKATSTSLQRLVAAEHKPRKRPCPWLGASPRKRCHSGDRRGVADDQRRHMANSDGPLHLYYSPESNPDGVADCSGSKEDVSIALTAFQGDDNSKKLAAAFSQPSEVQGAEEGKPITVYIAKAWLGTLPLKDVTIVFGANAVTVTMPAEGVPGTPNEVSLTWSPKDFKMKSKFSSEGVSELAMVVLELQEDTKVDDIVAKYLSGRSEDPRRRAIMWEPENNAWVELQRKILNICKWTGSKGGWSRLEEKHRDLIAQYRYRPEWESSSDAAQASNKEACLRPADERLDLILSRGWTPVHKPRGYSSSRQTVEPFVYPKDDPDAVIITNNDLQRLEPMEFLNDTLIDFYIKYLQKTGKSETLQKYHFLNSFFFKKLTENVKNARGSRAPEAYKRVRKWTRHVDIFTKDFIIVPVNQSLHWSLAIICHPGQVMAFQDYGRGQRGKDSSSKVPCILHLDSLEGGHRNALRALKSYLCEAWISGHGSSSRTQVQQAFESLKLFTAKVPQQDNHCDCGLFLLHYVELFLRENPSAINLSKDHPDFPRFLQEGWFRPREASAKRKDIRRIILEEYRSSSLEKAENLKPGLKSTGLAALLPCDDESLKASQTSSDVVALSQFSGAAEEKSAASGALAGRTRPAALHAESGRSAGIESAKPETWRGPAEHEGTAFAASLQIFRGKERQHCKQDQEISPAPHGKDFAGCKPKRPTDGFAEKTEDAAALGTEFVEEMGLQDGAGAAEEKQGGPLDCYSAGQAGGERRCGPDIKQPRILGNPPVPLIWDEIKRGVENDDVKYEFPVIYEPLGGHGVSERKLSAINPASDNEGNEAILSSVRRGDQVDQGFLPQETMADAKKGWATEVMGKKVNGGEHVDKDGHSQRVPDNDGLHGGYLSMGLKRTSDPISQPPSPKRSKLKHKEELREKPAICEKQERNVGGLNGTLHAQNEGAADATGRGCEGAAAETRPQRFSNAEKEGRPNQHVSPSPMATAASEKAQGHFGLHRVADPKSGSDHEDSSGGAERSCQVAEAEGTNSMELSDQGPPGHWDQDELTARQARAASGHAPSIDAPDAFQESRGPGSRKGLGHFTGLLDKERGQATLGGGRNAGETVEEHAEREPWQSGEGGGEQYPTQKLSEEETDVEMSEDHELEIHASDPCSTEPGLGPATNIWTELETEDSLAGGAEENQKCGLEKLSQSDGYLAQSALRSECRNYASRDQRLQGSPMSTSNMSVDVAGGGEQRVPREKDGEGIARVADRLAQKICSKVAAPLQERVSIRDISKQNSAGRFCTDVDPMWKKVEKLAINGVDERRQSSAESEGWEGEDGASQGLPGKASGIEPGCKMSPFAQIQSGNLGPTGSRPSGTSFCAEGRASGAEAPEETALGLGGEPSRRLSESMDEDVEEPKRKHGPGGARQPLERSLRGRQGHGTASEDERDSIETDSDPNSWGGARPQWQTGSPKKGSHGRTRDRVKKGTISAKTSDVHTPRRSSQRVREKLAAGSATSLDMPAEGTCPLVKMGGMSEPKKCTYTRRKGRRSQRSWKDEKEAEENSRWEALAENGEGRWKESASEGVYASGRDAIGGGNHQREAQKAGCTPEECEGEASSNESEVELLHTNPNPNNRPGEKAAGRRARCKGGARKASSRESQFDTSGQGHRGDKREADKPRRIGAQKASEIASRKKQQIREDLSASRGVSEKGRPSNISPKESQDSPEEPGDEAPGPGGLVDTYLGEVNRAMAERQSTPRRPPMAVNNPSRSPRQRIQEQGSAQNSIRSKKVHVLSSDDEGDPSIPPA